MFRSTLVRSVVHHASSRQALSSAARSFSRPVMAPPCALQSLRVQGQRKFGSSAYPRSCSLAEFVKQHGLTAQDVAELREATQGIVVRVVSEIADPALARSLRVSAIDPIIQQIEEDPQRSWFQNEKVTKLTRASERQPFSNFAMHLAPGGQDGIHVHPYGPRNLVVLSDRSWVLLCSRSPMPGEDPGGIKRIARVVMLPGQYVVSLPANRPHGFEAVGDGTVAYSIHAFDEQEVRAAGIRDSKDVMANLTRDLGSEGLTVIGGVDAPLHVISALHA